jgi:hypothetical protein
MRAETQKTLSSINAGAAGLYHPAQTSNRKVAPNQQIAYLVARYSLRFASVALAHLEHHQTSAPLVGISYMARFGFEQFVSCEQIKHK